MSTLQAHINALATEFANGIVRAMAGASFADIAALTSGSTSGSSRSSSSPKAAPKRKRGRPAKKASAPAPKTTAPAASAPTTKNAAASKPGKPPKKPLMRRGPAEIAALITKIVDVVAKKAGGMRSEEIAKALGLKSNELPRPLTEAVANKKLTKKGEKRATTYSVAKK